MACGAARLASWLSEHQSQPAASATSADHSPHPTTPVRPGTEQHAGRRTQPPADTAVPRAADGTTHGGRVTGVADLPTLSVAEVGGHGRQAGRNGHRPAVVVWDRYSLRPPGPARALKTVHGPTPLPLPAPVGYQSCEELAQCRHRQGRGSWL